MSLIEMSVESIRVNLLNYQRVVILKEKESDRYLPIWIGPAEADAIAIKLQNVSVPRPMTHDLLGSVISTLGARVNSIVVNDLCNDTFYAKVILDMDGNQVDVDSRPSDAIALAVRTKVPIFAEESVLAKAGVKLDKEAEEATGQNMDEAELKRLSAFKDFINTLDLDDFGKSRGTS